MIIHLITLLILLSCMIADVRTHRVPNMFLLLLMVLSIGYGFSRSLYSPVIFFVLLFPISDLGKRSIRILVAIVLALIAILLQPAMWMVTLSILGLWLLWEFRTMGGADMKLMASTIFIANTPIVLLPMFLIGGIQGLIALFQRKKDIPFVFSIFFGFLFYTFTLIM